MRIVNMQCEKDKNFVKFNYELSNGNSKYFCVDLNTGEIGGKRVKHLAKATTSRDTLYQAMRNIDSPLIQAIGVGILYSDSDCWTIRESNLKEIQFIEKMVNACLDKEVIKKVVKECRHYSLEINNYILKNISAFLKMLNKIEVVDDENQSYFMTFIINSLNIKNENFDDNMIEEVVENILSNYREEKIRYLIDRLDYVLRYFNEGLYEYEGTFYRHYRSTAMERINSYFEMCDELEIKYAKKDFLKSFKAVLKDFKAYKEYKDNLEVREHQLAQKEMLSFENEKYTIIIPTTVEEILTEAKRQKNCLASYVGDVVNGNCNIVFVREKENVDKNLITCEVRHGMIRQYYRPCNQRANEEENLFKKLYQAHLDTFNL